MGLDMYLYEVSKPDIAEGFSLTEDEIYTREEDGLVLFNEEEYIAFPYKEYLVKGEIKKWYIEIKQILIDVMGLTSDMVITSKYGGVKYCDNQTVNMLYITIKKDYKVKTGNSTVVQQDDGFAIKCNVELKEEDVETATYKAEVIFENSFTESGGRKYNGKYIVEQYEVVYVVNLEEICYQRKGLTDAGWDALPENCSYCGDERVIETLCKTGGLSEKFLEKWENGKTVFCPWW